MHHMVGILKEIWGDSRDSFGWIPQALRTISFLKVGIRRAAKRAHCGFEVCLNGVVYGRGAHRGEGPLTEHVRRAIGPSRFTCET